jgi:hypothetical protein
MFIVVLSWHVTNLGSRTYKSDESNGSFYKTFINRRTALFGKGFQNPHKMQIGGDLMALFVKSAVRGKMKGMRASEDFFKELDGVIARKVELAIKRAKGNGRKTLRGYDL